MSGWMPQYNGIGNFETQFQNGLVQWDGHTSDATLNAFWQMYLMQQQYGMNEQWFNDYDSPDAVYSQLRALGFSDAFISQYLLGQGASSQVVSSPSASGGSASGSLDNLANMIGAGNGSVDALNNVINTQMNQERTTAEIDLMKSESALNYANASEVSGLASSQNAERYSNVASNEQGVEESKKRMEEADARIQLIGQQYELTKEETRQAKQFADHWPEMNEAELKLKRAKTSEALSQASKNREEVEKMKHEEQEIDSQRLLNEANTDVALANRENIVTDTYGKRLQNHHQEVVNKVEDCLGFPLEADDKKIVQQYVEKGDYAGLDNFLQASFDIKMMSPNSTELGSASQRLIRRSANSYYHDFGSGQYHSRPRSHFNP